MNRIFTEADFWNTFGGLEVPHEVLTEEQLSFKSRLLFCFIRQACKRDQRCYIPNKELASFLGVSPPTVKNYLRQLIRIDWIAPMTEGIKRPPIMLGGAWIAVGGGHV